MPAIRDEKWKHAKNFSEGLKLLENNEEDVRFSGLVLGQDKLQYKELGGILNQLRKTSSKNFCLDWFDVDTKTLSQLKDLGSDDFVYDLNSFHLTMIDLSTEERLSPISSIVSNNKSIVDLILTFCKINDSNVHLLGNALENNETVLSLNINFNLLKRDGYLTLADSLVKNRTLRYLEAKLNKADKNELGEFVRKLNGDQGNTSIEYLDLGQEDDIDGIIKKNNIPDIQTPRKPLKKVSTKGDLIGKKSDGEAETTVVVVETTPPTQQEYNLLADVKAFESKNKTARVERETALKKTQLDDILKTEATSIRASLKHCKIFMLGDKGVGKTFFAHCLVHQLYHKNEDPSSEKSDKLKGSCTARVTELGWTRISDFHHVDMVLAKKISTIPVNMANREKANEVMFQFPDQVVIKASDLSDKDNLLRKEDDELLRAMKLENVGRDDPKTPVFSNEENITIKERFGGKMNELLEQAVRENNYPSFSIWDLNSPPGLGEVFRFFFNNHGLIFVFFSIDDVKKDRESVIRSVLKYLRPIEISRKNGKDFSSKVLLVGTFLDKVLNDGKCTELTEWSACYKKLEAKGLLKMEEGKGHLSFLANNLTDAQTTEREVLTEVRQMLMAFNVDLHEAIRKEFGNDIVPNDDDDLCFFPVSNFLPTLSKNFRKDFDDISGINKFRAKVRELIDKEEIKILKVMKSLRDAKIIDHLVERKKPRTGANVDPNFEPDFMMMQEFQEVAETAGLTSPADIAILLRYLDVTGIVSWLNDSQSLQETIVLNPSFIMDGLKDFYTAMTDNSEREAFMKDLEAGATDKQGLAVDLELLKEKRLVTSDMLTQNLIGIKDEKQPDKRSHRKYFQEFLLRCNHINELDLECIHTVFGKHNFGNFQDIDSVFVVPDFSEVDSMKDSLSRTKFLPYKMKFVLTKGIVLKGFYEKFFTSFLAALNNDGMLEQLLASGKEKNELKYENGFAEMRFGPKMELTISLMKGKEDNEKEGYLQFEFTEAAASLFFDFTERVMRNGSADFETEGFVLNESKEWISVTQAKKEELKPFVSKGSKFAPELDVAGITEAFDEL